jgi:hypothetical protein
LNSYAAKKRLVGAEASVQVLEQPFCRDLSQCELMAFRICAHEPLGVLGETILMKQVDRYVCMNMFIRLPVVGCFQVMYCMVYLPVVHRASSEWRIPFPWWTETVVSTRGM